MLCEVLNIAGISLQKRSPEKEDFKLVVRVKKGSKRQKAKNNGRGISQKQAERAISENSPKGIPVEFKEEEIDSGYDACGSRGDNKDVLEAGIGIHDDTAGTTGTIGHIGWDADWQNKVIITADHVMEGAPEMYQSSSEVIGTFLARDQGADVTAYEYNPSASADADPQGLYLYEDIDGYYNWAGLVNIVNGEGEEIDVKLHGKNSCTVSNTVIGAVESGSRVDYQVRLKDRNAQGGDSGGPWVDHQSDGNHLVAFHSGWEKILWQSWDLGVSADKAFESLDAIL